MGGTKKYIEMFGSFTEPFSCIFDAVGIIEFKNSRSLVILTIFLLSVMFGL